MITPLFGVPVFQGDRDGDGGAEDKKELEGAAGDSDGQERYREQRRHPRHSLAVRCWLVQGPHTVYLRLHDVSLGGMSVRAPVPFAAGDALVIELELPTGHTVRAKGEVRWRRQTEDSGPRMGASFTEFLSGQDDLRRLLDHQEMR